MSANPYESPSTAVLEEAQRARAVLDVSQRSVVGRFLVFNRLVAFLLIAVGVITIIVPLFSLIVLRLKSHPLGVGLTMFQGSVICGWGFLQLKRSIAAIMFTSVLVVALFILAVIPAIAALFEGKVPSDPRPPFTAILYGSAFAIFLVWSLVFVPAWLAIRAWRWHSQGIDLANLNKIKYVDAASVDPQQPL
jgi:hypothetical protein